jgi:ubiquinone biosynthesis accessory factor UbiJ
MRIPQYDRWHRGPAQRAKALMISTLSLQALSLVINRALELDALTSKQLSAFANQSLRIECSEPAFDFVLLIDERSKVQLSPYQAQTVTTHIRGHLSAFVQLAQSEDKASAMMNSGLYLNGNSQFLQDLSVVLQHLDIDWEYHLADKIGDLPAHLLGKLGRQGQAWLAQKQPLLTRHLQEFVLEETKLSPRHDELEQFIQDVQQLKFRTEHLEAKLQRLLQGKNV